MDKIKWLRIELTNICNFNCSYCAEQFMTRKKGVMDINLVKKIIDEVSKTQISDIIGLQFMGEGLLYPKFSEVAVYAKDKGVKLKLVTNGSVLTEENINYILSNNFEDVYISFFTPDEYSYQIRKTDSIGYEEYENRIKNMVRKKIENRAKTKISIGLLNSRYCFFPGIEAIEDNSKARGLIISWIRYIERIQKQSGVIPRSHDFKKINKISDFLDGWTYSLTDDISIAFIEVGTWANQLLLKRGVKVIPNKKGFCLSPFEQLFIAWDGACTCCCLDFDCRMKVGDANNDSIVSIWNSDKYRLIREGMSKNLLIDPYCQICRGKIDLPSFLKKADMQRLLRMLWSKEKLLYLLKRGWRRFKI